MSDRNFNVVFLALENAISTSIFLPMELFRAAETLAQSQQFKSTAVRAPKLNISTVSVASDGKPTHAGISLTDNKDIDELEQANIVVIPGLWRNPFPVVRNNYAAIEWLQELYRNPTTHLIAVGTGCCLLAEAGLLDDRIATTHWYFFDRFAKRYPKVNLQRNHFITRSDRLFTAASVNTVADVIVYFIETHFGSSIASEVERHFFHEVRHNYRKLVLEEKRTRAHHDEIIANAQVAIEHGATQAFDIETYAAAVGMSRRTFDRRFKSATGCTPLTYIQRCRIDLAQELIQHSNLNTTEIMHKTGYQDFAHFSKVFKNLTGVSPRQYRATVRPKIFSSVAELS